MQPNGVCIFHAWIFHAVKIQRWTDPTTCDDRQSLEWFLAALDGQYPGWEANYIVQNGTEADLRQAIVQRLATLPTRLPAK